MVLRRRREGSTFARPLSVVGLLVLAEMDYRGMEFGPRWGRGFDTGTLGCSDRPMCQCDNSFATTEETHVDTLTSYRSHRHVFRCSFGSDDNAPPVLLRLVTVNMRGIGVSK